MFGWPSPPSNQIPQWLLLEESVMQVWPPPCFHRQRVGQPHLDELLQHPRWNWVCLLISIHWHTSWPFAWPSKSFVLLSSHFPLRLFAAQTLENTAKKKIKSITIFNMSTKQEIKITNIFSVLLTKSHHRRSRKYKNCASFALVLRSLGTTKQDTQH